MNVLIAFCLRLAALFILVVLIALAGRAAFWVAKPLWPSKVPGNRKLLVETFSVVEGNEVQRLRGEAFASLLSAHVNQIEKILTTKLKISAKGDVTIEREAARQYETEPAANSRIDFVEAKPFGVDVVGLLSFARRQLHDGDFLEGIVVLKENSTEVFAEVVAGRQEIGPVSLPAGGGLASAAEALSYRVVRELRDDDDPLSSLTDGQFAQFVTALRNYQIYARNPAAKDSRELLKRAAQGFEALDRENVEYSLVYSYLSSIRTLQPERDPDSALLLLAKALELSPGDPSLKERIELLRKQKPTLTEAPARAFGAASLLEQPAFALVRLQEALEVVGKERRIKIALLSNGVNTSIPLLNERVVAIKSFVSGESPTEDRIDFGTHVASFLVTLVPEAEIVVAKVLTESGVTTTLSLLEGINFALEQKANVLIAPLAGSAKNQAEQHAFKEAERQGMVVIASSGNLGSSGPLYPAAYPDVIAVGAVNVDGKRARYSNFGSHVALFAPGTALGLTSEGQVQKREGTTYAATLAGGIAALVMQTGPSKAPADVRRILMESSVQDDTLRRLDALNAVLAARGGV